NKPDLHRLSQLIEIFFIYYVPTLVNCRVIHSKFLKMAEK
ncbi:site-specific integrase, partial [Vibrio anguillarum]|nr:site-specific integrase [Vibrio anguillarum]